MQGNAYCPRCNAKLTWTGGTDSYAVYSCPTHGEKFHQHHDLDEHEQHNHDGLTHVLVEETV